MSTMPEHISLSSLDHRQRQTLNRGQILDAEALLMLSPQEIARKCKISPLEATHLVEVVCANAVCTLRRLDNVKDEGSETCTTADANLDAALGGGIRPGMIWEVAGESSAGKSQLAFQISLCMQLPRQNGGLDASTCYLTTSGNLPTTRIVEIWKKNPILSAFSCTLDHIHTMSVATIPLLTRVLSETLPNFIASKQADKHTKPFKLLVIDALAVLFHTSGKTSTSTLVERSKSITKISGLLHHIARTYNIAVLVINEVVDVFDHGGVEDHRGSLLYSVQSRWFSRSDSVPGEDRKEASLGLTWANQINARILLTSTRRRRYIGDEDERKDHKRLKGSGGIESSSPLNDSSATLIRRLSIIFSSVSAPKSLDYIVTERGISTLPSDDPLSPATLVSKAPPATSTTVLPGPRLDPLDLATALNRSSSPLDDEEPDEWGKWDEEIAEADFEAIDELSSVMLLPAPL